MSEHAASNQGGLGRAPAPGWARTERPLSIALLGWARPALQMREGSGYNLNKSELARGLAMSGHRVFTLASGMVHRFVQGPRIVRRETWAGVECFELRNSPNLAPAAFNFSNMDNEIASPATTRLVLEWLDSVGAQVVHIHSLEGYGLDLIGAVEASGRPVIVTPHNYWYVCPQVDLLYKERGVCVDYDGGRKCESCMPAVSVASSRRMKAAGQTLDSVIGPQATDGIRKFIYGLKPGVKSVIRGRPEPWPLDPQEWTGPHTLADPETPQGFRTDGPNAPVGETLHDFELDPSEQPKDYERAPLDQNERVLSGRDRHLVVLNTYGRRRRAGVEALSRASLITPPSDYVRRVHVAMGVPEEKTRWVRLGQPHFDQINRRARRSPFYDVSPWDPKTATRPLRFGFLGTTRPNKGLEVLTRAIPLLAPRVRQRCVFVIRALGLDRGFRRRLSRFPEVSVWGGYDTVQLIAAAGEYDVGVLPHIWLENSPLVLLENFHAGKLVICSRLGGPVDWVKDPADHPTDYTGLLFPGGDERALAGAITRIVEGEVAVPSPRAIHERVTLRSYPDHVAEVESIYRELLDKRR